MENNFKIKSNQKVKQIHVRSKEEKDGKGEKGEGKIHREVSLEKEEKGCQIESEMKREWKEENGESDNDVRKEDDRGEEDQNSQPKAQIDDNAQDKHNPRLFSHSPPAPPSVDDDTSATSLSSSMSLISLIYNKESKRNQFLMSNLSTNNVLVAGPGAPSGHIPRELHVPMPESFNINRKAAGTSPFLFANQPQSYLSYPKKTRPEVPWDSSPPVKYHRHQGQGHGEDGSNGMKRREVCPLRVLMRNYVGDSHSSSSVVASEMLPSVPSRHKNESKEEENAVEDFLCEVLGEEQEPAGTTDQEKGSGNKILSGEWKDLWLCKMKELNLIQHEIHHTDLRELNQLPVCPTPTPSSASSHGNIATGTGERGTNKGRGVTASAEAVAHIFEYLYCLLVGNPSPGYLLHHPNPSSFQLTSCSPTQTPRRKSRQRSAERSSKATSLKSPEKGKEEKEARKLLLKESGPLLAFLQQIDLEAIPRENLSLASVVYKKHIATIPSDTLTRLSHPFTKLVNWCIAVHALSQILLQASRPPHSKLFQNHFPQSPPSGHGLPPRDDPLGEKEHSSIESFIEEEQGTGSWEKSHRKDVRDVKGENSQELTLELVDL